MKPLIATAVCLLVASAAGADPPALPVAKAVVFSIGGSGEMSELANSLNRAANGCPTPLEVRYFRWNHGMGMILLDLRSKSRHRDKGAELACQIQALRESCPEARIHLVAHSSGVAVVLAAAELLPAGSVDRIIFLAPACSTTCDLRPTLRCACEGVHVFYSSRDLVGRTLPLPGTTDGSHNLAAGVHGFEPVGDCAEDRALYQSLRHYRDHFGGHYACIREAFVQENVLPLLRDAGVEGAAAPYTAVSRGGGAAPSDRTVVRRTHLTPLAPDPMKAD